MNPFANGASIQGSFGTDDTDHLTYLRKELARLRRAQVFEPNSYRDWQIAVLEDEIDECLNAEELR